VQACEVGADTHAQVGVEVRKRLVHQGDLRPTSDRASHGDTLTLPSRERPGAAIEEVVEPEELGYLVDAAVDLVLRRLADAKAIAQVLAHVHVRVEGVVLEHHGDVATSRLDVGDVAFAEVDRALVHRLEARDHPQQRRLAAAGGPDEHHELTALDRKADPVDRLDAAGERLPHSAQDDRAHGAGAASMRGRTDSTERRCSLTPG
jgi:hypothetical protein